jgi:hypothetical protein
MLVRLVRFTLAEHDIGTDAPQLEKPLCHTRSRLGSGHDLSARCEEQDVQISAEGLDRIQPHP